MARKTFCGMAARSPKECEARATQLVEKLRTVTSKDEVTSLCGEWLNESYCGVWPTSRWEVYDIFSKVALKFFEKISLETLESRVEEYIEKYFVEPATKVYPKGEFCYCSSDLNWVYMRHFRAVQGRLANEYYLFQSYLQEYPTEFEGQAITYRVIPRCVARFMQRFCDMRPEWSGGRWPEYDNVDLGVQLFVAGKAERLIYLPEPTNHSREMALEVLLESFANLRRKANDTVILSAHALWADKVCTCGEIATSIDRTALELMSKYPDAAYFLTDHSTLNELTHNVFKQDNIPNRDISVSEDIPLRLAEMPDGTKAVYIVKPRWTSCW